MFANWLRLSQKNLNREPKKRTHLFLGTEHTQKRLLHSRSGSKIARINLWSSPRCSSTSLMYSFAQRGDCSVYDEPLYAFYLKVSGEDRPYRDEVLKAQDNDGNKVVSNIIMGNGEKINGKNPKVIFFKHMAKQLIWDKLDTEFLRHTDNVLLVRHPFKVFSSYYRAMKSVNLHDTCLPDLCRIKNELLKINRKVIVVQNETLLKIPERTLESLCRELSIPFYPERMLSWEAGGRPEDGAWASHWYESTHKKTGFVYPDIHEDKDPRDYLQGLPDTIVSTAYESLPYYEELLEYDVSN